MLPIATLALAAVLSAPQEGYKTPPPEIVELLDAPLPPAPRISPDASWILIVERPSMPSIEDVARPWIGLAGMRIDPARNAPHRVSFDTGLVLRDLAGEEQRRIALPPDARIGRVDWSHTSRHFAFTLAEEDDLELWVGDVESGAARRVAEGLNGLFGAHQWMPDGVRLLAKRIPDGRGPAPAPRRAPHGPSTMETSGRKSPARTYQDLLGDEHDARLFEHYARAQLTIVDPRDGTFVRLGKPDLVSGAEVSPDGAHVLVTTLHRPFSYTLPASRFPERMELWSLAGKLERLVADAPLQDAIPIEGVRTGPRRPEWHAGEPATLLWVEALDGGDPENEVEHRDRWMALAAPFEGQAQELFRVQHRARGLSWLADASRVLASEYDRDRRWVRATLRDLAAGTALGVLEDRSVHDRYGNPGPILTEVRSDGTRVALQRGEWIHRAGPGDTPEGAQPFLDRQSLGSGATERLWRCERGVHESVEKLVRFDPSGAPVIVTSRETPVEPPNLRLRELGAGTDRALTSFPDPQPSIRGIQKELVKYERADGVQLSATLYTPAGHVEGTRLPLVVWAYPLEYTDPDTAGQVGSSPHRFTTLRGASHLFFLTQGYAVMDAATMPVVGDPETMNDAFVEQVAASAQAAIDFAASRGVADPTRAGVGGHSYGAFMTANLLAHTDLFRAGCARSGAYNRSLTPFGFQSERRTLWEATEAYQRVSPFFHAEKIDEPLLLIHGEKDSNSGTYPMQSERLYQAIAGNGGTVRLVLLPEESHGYVARESVLHAVAEMIEWFDRFVKGGGGGAGGEASMEAEER